MAVKNFGSKEKVIEVHFEKDSTLKAYLGIGGETTCRAIYLCCSFIEAIIDPAFNPETVLLGMKRKTSYTN